MRWVGYRKNQWQSTCLQMTFNSLLPYQVFMNKLHYLIALNQMFSLIIESVKLISALNANIIRRLNNNEAKSILEGIAVPTVTSTSGKSNKTGTVIM